MVQQNLKLELERRKSQTKRILDRIKQGNATNVDLARIGTRYTERVRELRAEGNIILAVYERPGLWRYVFKGQKPDFEIICPDEDDTPVREIPDTH